MKTVFHSEFFVGITTQKSSTVDSAPIINAHLLFDHLFTIFRGELILKLSLFTCAHADVGSTIIDSLHLGHHGPHRLLHQTCSHLTNSNVVELFNHNPKGSKLGLPLMSEFVYEVADWDSEVTDDRLAKASEDAIVNLTREPRTVEWIGWERAHEHHKSVDSWVCSRSTRVCLQIL